MRTRPWRGVRRAIAGSGVGMAFLFFFAIDFGGTIRGTVRPSDPGWWGVAAGVLVLWALPFVYYALRVKTRGGTLAGLLLLTAEIFFLVSLFRDRGDSGPSVIAYPLLLAFLSGFIAMIDGWGEDAPR